jgi:hypothetical protein
MDRVEAFRQGVKLVALYQATLEQMDTMKRTALYKQNIKKMMNTLEREIERAIQAPLTALDKTDEKLMTNIQNNIEMILDMSLGELAQLKQAVKEHREKNETLKIDPNSKDK